MGDPSNPTQLVARSKIGVLPRVFCREEKDLPGRIVMLEEMFARLGHIKVGNRAVASRTDVLVWADQRYNINGTVMSDFGGTAAALKEHFDLNNGPGTPTNIINCTQGDMNCVILNRAVMRLAAAGFDYVLMFSPDVYSYLTQEVVEKMLQAICDGALVTGVAINEMQQNVLSGFVQNTFAIWSIEHLMAVGGFDLISRTLPPDHDGNYLKGFNEKEGEVFYAQHGVEEARPVARLIEWFGPQVIAPIMPSGVGEYVEPDPDENPDEYWRNVRKFATKETRQSAMLAGIGRDRSYVMQGVMDKHRHPSVFKLTE